MLVIKALHITNHPGTILNLNQLATYINTSGNTSGNTSTNAQQNPRPLHLDITTQSWIHPYYVNKSLADEIFQSLLETISKYDILIFTDTPMYARPFLQNLDSHVCGIIVYITNRFDWGIWGFQDSEYYNLFKSVSLEHDTRIQFIADNQYDQYYALHKAGVRFAFPECVRLTPAISKNSTSTMEMAIIPTAANANTNTNTNTNKFFIQNRGTPITAYNHILDQLGIRYDVFDSNHRYRDKAHIGEYLGVLHLPYQVNIQSLMENLGAGLIHFLPSKTFFRHLLVSEGWYYWEERHRGAHLLEKSIELAEWYSPVLSDCFIYFDSWDDLKTKYDYYTSLDCNSNARTELLEKKQYIITLVQSLTQDNISRWRELFQRFLQIRPTLITMFYNVRRMDGDISDWHRAESTYYQLANKFILRLRLPLVICIEPDNTALADLVMETRTRLGLEYITYIRREKFEDTYFHQYIPRLQELRGQYIIRNGNPRHETPRYITLNNNKFHFLEQVIRENAFQSDRYIWMDMGINHVAQKPQHIIKWIYKIPAPVKQLCINPYLELDSPRDLFHNIFHHTAGGLITGSSSNLLKYVELYKAKWIAILAEGWYQIDEAIMSMVQREHRELFTFYYGDYEGIIANYDQPDLSMNLIMQAADKTVRYNRLDETFVLMVYLRPYFQMDWNQHSGHFYQYIQYNIICNWQCNNEMLLDDVIRLINMKIVGGDWYIKTVLDNHKELLQRYRNASLINSY